MILSLVGLTAFAVLFGAGVGSSAVSRWLLSPTDNLVTLVGSSFVLLGLLATARQWKEDAEVKREEARSRRHAEYAERLAGFRTWQTNAAIMMILNYDRDVIIRADSSAERVSWPICELALIPAPYRRYLYEPTLIAIRDCFDDWIGNISRLVYLEGEGLVKSTDVDHLCKSLLLRVSRETQFASTPFARNLRLYIQWNGAARVLALFNRYGADIRPMLAADKAALSRDIEAGRYGDCEPSSWGSL